MVEMLKQPEFPWNSTSIWIKYIRLVGVSVVCVTVDAVDENAGHVVGVVKTGANDVELVEETVIVNVGSVGFDV